MRSIRRQLTREMLASLSILLGAGLVAIGFTVRTRLTHALDATLLAQGRAVGALTEYEGGRIQFDFSQDFLREYDGRRARHYFELWTTSGTVIRRSPALRGADLERPATIVEGRPRFYDLTLPNGRHGRAVCLRLKLQETDPRTDASEPGRTTVDLVAAIDRGELDETLSGLIAAVAGIGVLMAAAVLVLVPRLLSRGLSPLERLGADASTIDAHTLSFRFETAKLPIELQPIADRLNELLARLEASFERERRFSADLAHELRTPLAELRSLLECALKWPESREPSTDQEALEIARELESLVGRMLAIARGERGSLQLVREHTEVAPFADECWRTHEAAARARGITLRFDVQPGAVDTDRTLFRSILSNLFENAVAYAPAGSAVEVWGGPRGERFILHVANPAGELTDDDVARLFDRFWRKDAARSGGRHLGLGLNLAATFADAMGWTIAAETDAQSRLVMTLGMTPLVRRARSGG
ncbi:sensor kinase CusS [mine drainage metagenome]|uniref:histidine kinase n=1 Tax=mine drainage metagenome TaxID=410659 RepID=A0A1J5S7G9_9ZZZZ